MTGYGTLLIFAAAISKPLILPKRDAVVLSRDKDLSLAMKVSPDAYAFDPAAWLPVVHALKSSNEKTAQSVNSNGVMSTNNQAPQEVEEGKVDM